MPIDPSIISNSFANMSQNMPDVNALMQQRVQGAENIYKIETARQTQAAEAEKEAAKQAAEAMLPAVASAFSDPSDAGFDLAMSQLPPEVAQAFTPFLQRMKRIPDLNLRKSLLRAELAKDDEGRYILGQLEPTANMRLQAETAAGSQSLAERRLQLDIQKAEAEAAGGGKVAEWITDDAGNVTGLDAQGNIVATRPGIGKKTAQPAGVKANTEEAKFKVDETLSELLSSYNKLKKGKAIVSTQDSALGNIVARTGAALGTTVGRAVGTSAQTERDYIQNLRTDLVRDIKLATGMSSQEINSNFELQAALDALGDPYSQSFETAVRTIQKLSRKYGLGNIKTPPIGGEDSGGEGAVNAEPPPAAATPTELPEGATTTNW